MDNPPPRKKDIWDYLFWPVLFAGIGWMIYTHGTRWEFGRYGMPRPLVAEDGWHYLDGAEVDGISLSLYRAGRHEEVMLALVLFMAVMFAGLLHIHYRLACQDGLRSMWEFVDEKAKQAEAEGRLQDAIDLLEWYAREADKLHPPERKTP
jgi:hypothetical protein